MYGAWPQLEKCGGCGCDSEFLLHALANGPLARGPLLDSAAKLGCKPENLHRLEGCLVQRKREEVGFITLYLGEFHMTRKGRKRLQAIADADAAPADTKY